MSELKTELKEAVKDAMEEYHEEAGFHCVFASEEQTLLKEVAMVAKVVQKVLVWGVAIGILAGCAAYILQVTGCAWVL